MASEVQSKQLPQALARLVQTRLVTQAPPLLVALCGWADTGKSTVARQLFEQLGLRSVSGTAISTDAFMKDRAERNALGISGYNPESIDIRALDAAISRFKLGEPFAYHPYDNKTGTRQRNPSIVEPCEILVVEGIHAFHPAVAERMHLKVFIESDEATLRDMRYRANMHKRGMSAMDARARSQAEWQDYSALVRPLFTSADLVVQVDRHFNYQWVI